MTQNRHQRRKAAALERQSKRAEPSAAAVEAKRRYNRVRAAERKEEQRLKKLAQEEQAQQAEQALIEEGRRIDERKRAAAEAAAAVDRAEARSQEYRAKMAKLGDSPADRARANALMGERLAELGLDPHAIGYSAHTYVPEERRYRDPLPRRDESDPRVRARQDAVLRRAGITPGGVVLPGGRENY